MAIIKPEMKSYIWLQTPDGSTQQVEEEVAMFCPMICREVLQTGMGSSKHYAIKLPQRVSTPVLGLILDYCRFHQVQGRSNKERKTFDEKFIRLDTKKLCELTSGADSLQLRPLVDLSSRALARMIEGKTPEEIRQTFHLPDDLTEEEKLEPLRIRTNDPRIRLLNRLYARKRKELKVRQQEKCMIENENVEIEEEPSVDDRSVDDLLLFINSGDEDSKSTAAKNKKKHRRRKDHNKSRKKERDGLCSSPSKNSKAVECDSPVNSSSEFDFDDELDPAMREQLDREVEDFARRLNSVWPKRVTSAAGMVSLGHDRHIPLSTNI